MNVLFNHRHNIVACCWCTLRLCQRLCATETAAIAVVVTPGICTSVTALTAAAAAAAAAVTLLRKRMHIIAACVAIVTPCTSLQCHHAQWRLGEGAKLR